MQVKMPQGGCRRDTAVGCEIWGGRQRRAVKILQEVNATGSGSGTNMIIDALEDTALPNKIDGAENVDSEENETEAETEAVRTKVESKDNPQLPPGWVAAIDADSGATYYQNEDTGESSWELPEQKANDQKENSDAPEGVANVETIENLPPGWHSVVDEETGDVLSK